MIFWISGVFTLHYDYDPNVLNKYCFDAAHDMARFLFMAKIWSILLFASIKVFFSYQMEFCGV